MKPKPVFSFRGISLPELLATISAIGIIAAIAVPSISSHVVKGSKEAKLENEMSMLNSAVNSYQAFGGKLDGSESSSEIVAKLKTVADDESAATLPGLSGSFIDQRVQLVYQTAEEAASSMKRLLWDDEKRAFYVSDSGAAGIKQIVLYSPSVETTPQKESRSSTMDYASSDTWIWDYDESKTKPSLSPTNFSTTPDPPGGDTPTPSAKTPVGDDDDPEDPEKTLDPPLFSIPAGEYSITEFPMELQLIDANTDGIATLSYSQNYTAWNAYENTVISISPGSVIQGQAFPVDSSEYKASGLTEAVYEAIPADLDPPDIDLSATSFSESSTIEVTLTNPNSEDVSEILFKIVPPPGSSGSETVYIVYSEPITVPEALYPDGFGVKAYARATAEYYNDSVVNSEFATDNEGLFGGHLDLDTSDFLAEFDHGGTSAHSHDITGKYNLKTIDFFSIPVSKQIEINEAITSTAQKFKISVVNGNLSPGLRIVISYSDSTGTHQIRKMVDLYDDTSVDGLMTFTLGSSDDTATLTGLKIEMGEDVIATAGVIPTNTGDVKGNTPGKNGEWRNGALTVQALAVNSDGSDGFTLESSWSNGGHGAASGGLLWEATLFWHWPGASYHDEDNHYEPGNYDSIADKL